MSEPAHGTPPRAAAGIRIAFRTENRPGQGEDADPILTDAPCDGPVVMAVFDGAGGAGAHAYESRQGRSGAYIASRLAREAVMSAIDAGEISGSEDLTDSARRVRNRLVVRFSAEAENLTDAKPSRIRSKMTRVLPTTLAMAMVVPGAETCLVGVMWAGDSRVYALTPTAGLLQLTHDHARVERDAFDSLYDDPPLSNVVSASRDFYLDWATYSFSFPVAILATTDGSYGYLRSPMHFEALLLEALCDADVPLGWSRGVEERVLAVTGDDASLTCFAPDVENVRSLAGTFRQRLAYVRRESLGDGESTAEGSAGPPDLRDAWERYRHGYSGAVPVNKGAAMPNEAPRSPAPADADATRLGEEVQRAAEPTLASEADVRRLTGAPLPYDWDGEPTGGEIPDPLLGPDLGGER